MSGHADSSNRKNRSQAGFTLIEMLIVVAIIAMIAAIAVPQIMTAMQKGRVATTQQAMRSLAQALAEYSLKHAEFPKIGDTASLVPVGDGLINGLIAESSYDKLNAEDSWGRPIYYGSDGINFTLRSYSQNGELDPATGEENPSDPNADIICINGNFQQVPK